GFTPAGDPFPLLYEEIALLAKAGIPAPQVIRSATLIGARTIGHEEDMGTLEPGKLANMVFVRKNPLADVENLRTLVLTVKRGVRYPRSAFKPVRADEVPAEYRQQ